jgi:hypothetical protein
MNTNRPPNEEMTQQLTWKNSQHNPQQSVGWGILNRVAWEGGVEAGVSSWRTRGRDVNGED